MNTNGHESEKDFIRDHSCSFVDLFFHRCASVPHRWLKILLCSSVLFLSGCSAGPDQANIDLRKDKQSLQSQVEELHRQREGDAATIATLQQNRTVSTLSHDELEKLFTTHNLALGRLTGDDPDKPGLKVFAVPLDEFGQPLKAAGSFVVEAFDLAKQSDNLVGRWEFSLDVARKNWYGGALLYTYVLECPWKNPPTHSQLTLKVTFHDELTQRDFTVQKVITVRAR